MTGRGARGLEEGKHPSYLHEGQEGGARELPVRQPHLSPWGGDGATNLGNHFQAYERQESHQEFSAWIHKGEDMLY